MESLCSDVEPHERREDVLDVLERIGCVQTLNLTDDAETYLTYLSASLNLTDDAISARFTLIKKFARILHHVLTQYFPPLGRLTSKCQEWVNRATTRLAVAIGSEDRRSSQR